MAPVSDQIANLPVGEVAPKHRFDEARLAQYLSAEMGSRGELSVRQFQGGASNPTFLLSMRSGAGTVHYVMRKKPPGALLPSAHQVDREYRIMRALAATDVPVPRMRLLCDDRGVIGTDFYVMDFVPGRIFGDPRLPSLSAEERAAVYASFCETLAKLHRVDFTAIGLGDFGKPGDYLERQIGRFIKQYRAAETETLPEMEHLMALLPRNLPSNRSTAIVHGDFKLGNMIFDPDTQRLVAVLDWELATIGDPLADLAFSALPWHRAAGDVGSFGNIAGECGIPTELDYVRAYLGKTGRTRIDGWNFYLAFSMFRLASIMQGVYRRVLDGTVASAFAPVNAAPTFARQALDAFDTADKTMAL